MKKVKYVVIMSGMADLDLKNQTIRNKAKAIAMFRYLLLEEIKYNDRLKTVEDVDMLIDELNQSIHIKWGNEINHYDGPTYNTLFVLDESHYAQDKHMKVDNFSVKNCIPFSGGNVEELVRRNVYTLSVSATPFSEICNVYHSKQHKKIVFLETGSGYIGLKQLWENNQIQPFNAENPEPIFRNCFEKMREEKVTNGSNTYLIARVLVNTVSKKDWNLLNHLKKIIQENYPDIDIWEYDSVAKKNKDCFMKSFDDLEKEPLKPTVILVKGMGRCGHNIPKQHLLFTIDTSIDPNSDVIQQGFLGRLSGYHNNTKVISYVTKKYYDSGEIQRAISFYNKDISQIPNYARNVIPKRECVKQKETTRVNVENEKGNPIMPIRLLNICPNIVENVLLSKSRDNVKGRLQFVRDWLQDMNLYDTQNSEDVIDELREQLNNTDNAYIRVSKVGEEFAVSKKVPPIILEANRSGIPKGLGSGKGSLYGEFTLHVFVDESFAHLGFHKGDVYLDGRTKKTFTSDMSRILPRTTGRELFSRKTFG